jgi:hypothetical protein
VIYKEIQLQSITKLQVLFQRKLSLLNFANIKIAVVMHMQKKISHKEVVSFIKDTLDELCNLSIIFNKRRAGIQINRKLPAQYGKIISSIFLKVIFILYNHSIKKSILQ